MTESILPRGNFIAFLNADHGPDDQRPSFLGRLTLPGVATERVLALWPSVSSNTGDTLFSGRVSESALSQIARLADPVRVLDPDQAISVAQRDGGKGLTIAPNAMLLFTNKMKDEAHPERPDYWGYFNPGEAQPLMRVAVWARTDMRGRAMLTGNVQDDSAVAAKTIEATPRKARSRPM